MLCLFPKQFDNYSHKSTDSNKRTQASSNDDVHPTARCGQLRFGFCGCIRSCADVWSEGIVTRLALAPAEYSTFIDICIKKMENTVDVVTNSGDRQQWNLNDSITVPILSLINDRQHGFMDIKPVDVPSSCLWIVIAPYFNVIWGTIVSPCTG